MRLWIGILLGLTIALAACGDKSTKVAQVTSTPTARPSPAMLTATPRQELPTQTPEPTATGGGLGQQGELPTAVPTVIDVSTAEPQTPTPDVTLEDLKEELFLSGTVMYGGWPCFVPPTDGGLPAAVVSMSYHQPYLCLWGFTIGQTVTVELYDPHMSLVAVREFPVETERVGASLVGVPLSFIGRPAGEWTMVASSPGVRIEDYLLVEEPQQPMLSAIPVTGLDIFSDEGWRQCQGNAYHAGEQVAVVGAGFPPRRNLLLGIYHHDPNAGEPLTVLRLISQLQVAADEQGRFTAYVPVEQLKGAGIYYTADASGASACFEVVSSPGLGKVEAVRLLYGGGPLKDPGLQEAILAALDKERVLKEVLRPEGGPEIAFLSTIGDREVNVYAIPYRPDWARYLLAQAGYRDGLKVVLAFPERDRALAALAKIVAGDLQQVGIDAQLAPMSTDEVLNLEKQVRRAGKPALWLRRHGGE